MRRHARNLKPIKSNTIPANWIVFDVIYSREAKNDSGSTVRLSPCQVHYRRWRIRDGDECCVSDGIAPLGGKFWTWLYQFLAPGTSTWIMSCSAYTDWTAFGLWQRILDGEILIDEPDASRPESDSKGGNKAWRGYVQLEDPPTVIVARVPDRNATFTVVDIRNYCATWSPSYIVSEHQYTDEGDDTFSLPQWEARRAERRIKRMRGFIRNITSWLEENSLGGLKQTFSSQSHSAWRHSFLTETIQLHNSEAALKLERQAYIGGRCECRIIGRREGRITQLDFNSLYPSCAAGYLLPVSLLGVSDSPTIPDLMTAVDQIGVIADVDVDIYLPAIPWRQADKIIYPIGQFRATLCGPELQLATTVGKITKCYSASLYNLGKPLHDFYKFWLPERHRWKLLADDDMASFMKLAGNGLIGKLGQRNKRWVRQPYEASNEPFESWFQLNPKTHQLTIWRSFANTVSYLDDDGEGYSSIPSIASYVNSYARVMLWLAMSDAGFHNIYYYDTDSIWTNDAGVAELWNQGLIDDFSPGKLKIVDTYSDVEFKGIKHYLADGKLTCAGRPKDGHLSHDWKCNTWEQRRVISDLSSKHQPFAELVNRKWESTASYTHGLVCPDGTVKPWRIQEQE